MKDKVLKCQKCNRVIVNRLIDNCQYCLEPIPTEHCLTEEEKHAYKEKMHQERESRKDLLKRKNEIGTGVGPFDGGGFDCGGDG